MGDYELIVSARTDGSSERVVGTYLGCDSGERLATLGARDYIAQGYRAWIKQGRVKWEVTNLNLSA